ncbi:MAG: CRTAC1 family protein [Planctomycetaceae bacterium]|nr:CRTAC1 family protein [Planctomycetaceae bacterium]
MFRVFLLSFLIGPLSGQLYAQDHIHFEDVAEELAFNFVHHSPPTKERHTHLMMGSGIGAWDYDLDGWPDVVCGQGATWDAENFRHRNRQPDRLYRNLRGELFQDVTTQAGFTPSDYAMGLAIGDSNNDGFPDLFINEFGENRLYLNQGDGTFQEIAVSSGLSDNRFGSSCSWADLDGDHQLDLIVSHYLKIEPGHYRVCTATHGTNEVPITCQPRYQPPAYDALYRNTRDGKFEDVTKKSGILDQPPRQGLGVVVRDFDGDRDLDFYVANDAVPNQLWINQGEFRFSEMGLLSGTAINQSGAREAGMGVVSGDLNRDGRLDLFVANYFNETNTFYSQKQPLLFLDTTDVIGLGAPSRPKLAFGVTVLDADLDGWKDLFVLNGHVNDLMEELGRPEPFAQRPQFYRNVRGRFQDISTECGSWFDIPKVGRSSARLDFNRDGRPDLAVLDLNSAAALLRNDSTPRGHFLRLKLIGTTSNRSAFGATIKTSDNQWSLCGSSGYLSCNENQYLLGFAADRNTVDLKIDWPAGGTQTFSKVPTDRSFVIVEGRERLWTLTSESLR